MDRLGAVTITWSQDGESLYFMWNPEAADIADLYVVSRDGGTPEQVPSDERRNVPPRGATRNRDETEAVYAAYGDLFLFTIDDGTVRRLTDTDTTERNPHFVLDERSVAFERDRNLFIVELDTGAVRQITNFRTGPDPDADPDQTPLQAYLEQQQTELFDYVRKTDRLEEERDERRDTERVFFLSERDGYFHLYVTGLDGGEPTQLTSGRFGLVDLRLSQEDERWFFLSNEVHPAENQLYTMPLDGGARTRLTTDRALRRQLWRVLHVDVDVQAPRRVQVGGGARPGDRLGALQPRVHDPDPQRSV